ncbi:MAG: NAD-dependent malic enzyme [Elusimicrobia bacterium]|nr:NAD-dependent malic enzyme [Elusimicrobiota bacterium]
MKENGYRASPSYTLTLRLRLARKPGTLAKALAAIGRLKAAVGAIDMVSAGEGVITRDVTVQVHDEAHGRLLLRELRKLRGIELGPVSDRTFLMHLGGKISVIPRSPLKTRDDLSMAYTPGVARVCLAIAEDRERAWSLTMKKNMVAIVTDGSRVLGLGNIGPEAALPVMEGKAMLFKTFGNVDAFPICLAAKTNEEIIAAVKMLAPGFGGVNLEDIAAPRCFELERRLRAELDIPVFHDDQHGTAIVTLAGLLNAVKLVGKKLAKLKVVVAGAGASGIAVSKMIMDAGVRHLIAFDRAGAIWLGRPEPMNEEKLEFARLSNPDRFQGSLSQALRGADVFIGLSGSRMLEGKDLARMARDPIVFPLSNPDPEIDPEIAWRYARIVATGRSDYPNQINNALAFPGVFRGALDVHARQINEAMNRAASEAIAAQLGPGELHEDQIVPSIFNPNVAPAVAAAVRKAARRSGVARRRDEEGKPVPNSELVGQLS